VILSMDGLDKAGAVVKAFAGLMHLRVPELV
jgi:hypothetical protein